jgi:hypothetical protein
MKNSNPKEFFDFDCRKGRIGHGGPFVMVKKLQKFDNFAKFGIARCSRWIQYIIFGPKDRANVLLKILAFCTILQDNQPCGDIGILVKGSIFHFFIKIV